MKKRADDERFMHRRPVNNGFMLDQTPAEIEAARRALEQAQHSENGQRPKDPGDVLEQIED